MLIIIYMENMKGAGSIVKNLATIKSMSGSKFLKVKKDHKPSLFNRLLTKYKRSGNSEESKIPETKIDNKIYDTGKMEKSKKGKNFHYSELVGGNVSAKLYSNLFESKSDKKTIKHLDNFSQKIKATKDKQIVPSDEKVTKRVSDKTLTEYKFPAGQIGYKNIDRNGHAIGTNKTVITAVDLKRLHGKDNIISLDKTKFEIKKDYSTGRSINADIIKTEQSDSYGQLSNNIALKAKISGHDRLLRKTAFDAKKAETEKGDKEDRRNTVKISKDNENSQKKEVLEPLRLQTAFDKKQSYLERQDQSAVFLNKAVRKTTDKRIKLNNLIDIAENITRISHQLSINRTALSAQEINAFNGSFKGQINSSISNALNFFPQTPTLSVNLYPPKLGRVFLKLSVTNGGIVLRLNAVNAATTTLIKNLTDDLRNHLSKNNIQIAKILVATIPQTASASSQSTLSNNSNASNWNNNGNKSDFFGSPDNTGGQNGRENLRKDGRRENRQFYGNSYYQGRINLWI